MSWRWRDGFALLLGLLPAYLVFVLLERYAVNVPHWDNWEMLILPELEGGGFSAHWELVNGHRTFLPRVAAVLLARATDFDARAWVLAKLPLATAVYGLQFLVFRQHTRSPQAFLLAAPFSLLTFSLAYWPMWVDPRPLGSFFALLSMLICVLAITALARGWPALLLAIAAAAASSLCFFSGNGTWFVLALLMWGRGYRHPRHYAAAGVAALAALIPNGVELLLSPVLSTIPPSLDPAATARYTLAFLGSPLAATRDASGVRAAAGVGLAGLVLLGILAAAVRRQLPRGGALALPWLAIALWVVLASLAGAVGRGAFGAEQALSPRYVSTATPFWSAVVALGAIALGEPRRSVGGRSQRLLLDVLPSGALLAIGALFLGANLAVATSADFAAFPRQLARARECVLRFETAADDCLRIVHGQPDALRILLRQLAPQGPSFLISLDLDFARATPSGDTHWPPEPKQHRVAGERHRVLSQHPPSRISWRLGLPRDARLALHTGLLVERSDEGEGGDGVSFAVLVDDGGGERELLNRHVRPRLPGGGFEPVRVDLAPYAGRRVDLILATTAGPDADSDLDYDWAFWLYPELLRE